MAELQLQNIRKGGDITLRVGLEDGGVAVDWSALEEKRAFLYSDEQRLVSGECAVHVDPEDSTVLVCEYSGDDEQYLGVNSVVVRAKYRGRVKVYDKKAVNIVKRTSAASGVVVLDDPVVTVQLSVEDVSTSLLENAIDAAVLAAARAEAAAEAAEHMVDIHQGPPGPAGKAPYIDETTGNWFVWDDQTEQYVDSGKHAQGATGNGIASWSVVESQEDGGSNVVTVVFTNGDSESFTVKNGNTGATPNLTIGTVETGAAGSQAEATMTGTAANPVLNLRIPQGVPGVVQAKYVQVDTLPTASASTMNALYLVPSQVQLGTYDIYYTSQDGRETYSWVFLCGTTIQLSDYATKEEVTQLEAEVADLIPTELDITSSLTWVDGMVYNGHNVSSNASYQRSSSFLLKKGYKVKFSGGAGETALTINAVSKDNSGAYSTLLAYTSATESIEYTATEDVNIVLSTVKSAYGGSVKIITNPAILQTLNNKVDKVSGKSLIDSDFADSQSVIQNPEYIQVTTDSQDRVVEGIKADGTSVFLKVFAGSVQDTEGKGLSRNNYSDGEKELVHTNEFVTDYDWKQVLVDENGRPVLGINTDNKLVLKIEQENPVIKEYETVRDAADDGRTGVFNVGGSLYKSAVSFPHAKEHKQDAYVLPYFDANGTMAEFQSLNGEKKPTEEYIANKVRQEEIDFTPGTGFTRIIVGKDSNDGFFVQHTPQDFGNGAGSTVYNKLEYTEDFVNFRTVFKYSGNTSDPGLSVAGWGAPDVRIVKQFANGDYLVASCMHIAELNARGTVFLKLKSDFSAITPITCTYLDGTTGLMVDEYENNVYDWHIDIWGSRAIVTTYGTRNPATDLGRVWYTEDGNTWKQVFQMTNHYQDGVEGETITQCHIHGVMIDRYTGRIYVIAGEDNRNIFWSDKGINTTDADWNVIAIRDDKILRQSLFLQVVNGYAFKDNIIFGSDCPGAGAIYRLNKIEDGYSKPEIVHEFLPNKFPGTYYCGAEMYRRDLHTPLFFCETRENYRDTQAENEALNQYHRARVVATYDGINFTEIWIDDTYGTHDAYINGSLVQKKFCHCTRGMNFYLLKNGNAVVKYSGRSYAYFDGGGYVLGQTKSSCKVKFLYDIEKYL